LIFLHCSLYCGGLEPNLQYLCGSPVERRERVPSARRAERRQVAPSGELFPAWFGPGGLEGAEVIRSGQWRLPESQSPPRSAHDTRARSGSERRGQLRSEPRHSCHLLWEAPGCPCGPQLEVSHHGGAGTSYKKTHETLSHAGQKATAAFSNVGTAISKKFGDMRNSPTFKSFEERVETTVTSLKTKVGGMNPNGGSFEEVLSSTAHASAQSLAGGSRRTKEEELQC
uniref:TPD52 like 1 n=1 Tax=Callithrix jacchus TaxID=9483 RepID=A0A8I3ZZ07_CALJA